MRPSATAMPTRAEMKDLATDQEIDFGADRLGDGGERVAQAAGLVLDRRDVALGHLGRRQSAVRGGGKSGQDDRAVIGEFADA